MIKNLSATNFSLKWLRIFAVFVIMLPLSGCKQELAPDTLVNAAILIEAKNVKTGSAEIHISSRQDNVVSYKFVYPQELASNNYNILDAIGRNALVNDKGVDITEVPVKVTGLEKLTDYFVAAIGYDASGNAVTAPTMCDFTTPDLSIAVSTTYLVADGEFTFNAKTIPDISTVEYRYIFDVEHSDYSNEDLKTLLLSGDSSVKTATEGINLEIKTDYVATAVFAAIPYDAEGRQGNLVTSYASLLPSVTVNLAESHRMKMPDKTKMMFEGTYDVPAQTTFTINVDNDEYGWTSFSGNGGVGVVTSQEAMLPVKSLMNATINGEPLSQWYEYYRVGRSVGQMSVGGNPFWVNESAPCKIFVRVDLTDEDKIPRYYIEKVKEDDPSVLLEETFDLFSLSGDYVMSLVGSQYVDYDYSYDGTEPAVLGDMASYTDSKVEPNQKYSKYNGPNKNQNNPGWDGFDYPDAVLGTVHNDKYIANRGVQGWTFVNSGEKPGYVSLGFKNPSAVITPPLASLEGTSDITVTVDVSKFVNGAAPMLFTVLNAGTITSVTLACDSEITTETLEVKDNVFSLTPDDKWFPKSYWNINHDLSVWMRPTPGKPITHLTFKVTGATSETQFKVYVETGGAGRSFYHGIKITK